MPAGLEIATDKVTDVTNSYFFGGLKDSFLMLMI